MEKAQFLVASVFVIAIGSAIVSFSMYEHYWGGTSELEENTNLNYIHILTAPGALSPVTQFPNTHKWKMLNQLTPMGMRHSYLVGAEFRQRYALDTELFPYHYNYSYLQAHSLDLNYTLQTAQCFMFGFYPPGTGPILENAVQYNATPPFYVENLAAIQKLYGHDALPHRLQPVPVKHIAPDDDHMLNGGYRCEKIEHAIKEYTQTPECQQKLKLLYNSTVQQAVQTLLGYRISWQESISLYEALYSDNLHGYSLDTKVLDLLEPLYTFYRLQIQLPNEYIAPLKASSYLKNLMDMFSQVSEGKTTFKGSFYFGSQEVFIALLKVFDVKTEYTLPPPSSTLVIEMHEISPVKYTYYKDMNYQVRMLYNDIPVLCDMCGLKDFKNMLYDRFDAWNSLADSCKL